MVADRAVAAVMDLVAQAGYAAEVVSKDYGEDLLVQTSHAGRMDASRLWLQVKGTANLDRHRLKSGDLRLPVSFDHALRWARSADLVVVVLWDVESSAGWYAVPLWQVDQIGGFINERRTITLQFDQRDAFSVETVHELAWESRIDHFQQLLVNSRSIDTEREEDGEERSKLSGILALDFLTLLGVVEKASDDPVLYAIDESAHARLSETFAWACLQIDDPDTALYGTVVQVLFDYVPKRCGTKGLPRVLIEECAEALVTLVDVRSVKKEVREL